MTLKRKKAKHKKARARPGKIDRLRASVEDDPLSLAEDVDSSRAARWNRPCKERICLRVDAEVLDWFKSLGAGYQTRMNRILRRAMTQGKKTTPER